MSRANNAAGDHRMSFDRTRRALAFGLAAAFAPQLAAATPGLSERVVSDPANGVALYGYDPVAYFTDGRAVPGRRDVEAEWAGAAWRFASEANRAVFLSRPEVYTPRFGGYDPAAVADGIAAAGHPLLFRVADDKLYLFRSPETRDAFESPQVATSTWPKVAAGLTN